MNIIDLFKMDQYFTFIEANAILIFSVPFQEGGSIDLAQTLTGVKGYTIVGL